MPAATPQEINEAIISSFSLSGYAAVLEPNTRGNPRRFSVVASDGRRESLWIYVWSLTPGGRPALPDELRIQMTSVNSPLALNPQGQTSLMGFEKDMGVFSGFDISKHAQFTVGSSSVQVDRSVLNGALQHGIFFAKKSNDEIVAGIRPDLLAYYLLDVDDIHSAGGNVQDIDQLEGAPVEAINLPAIDEQISERPRVVRQAIIAVRSASFRRQVMLAYDNRCAVTRTQLKLVEAAHILPVAQPGSPDDVRNGIALSPTYHRAYDAGLIYLDQDYEMKPYGPRIDELRQMGLHGGIDAFLGPLGRVHLPYDRQQYPDLELIERAKEARGTV